MRAIGGAAGVGVVVASALMVPASAQVVPDAVPELPVVSTELGLGVGRAVPQRSVRPSAKTINGDPTDWIGEATGFGGTAVFSAGEYVYQDRLFDARGADDGGDAERLALLDPLQDAEPRTYRIEALIGQDPPSQFGIDTPAPLKGEEHYGDAGLVDVADLVEVRVAATPDGPAILARTTTMTSTDQTAVLVLVDTQRGGGGAVPFGSGLESERADAAFLLAGDSGWQADLATGAVTPLPAGSVATDPSGWVNAIEALLPDATAAGRGGRLSLAVATGRFDPAGPALATLAAPGGDPLASNVANVAFRFRERVRTWFDRGQALDLLDGTIDAYFVDLLASSLRRGRTERYEPGPGYHDRIFVSRVAEGPGFERQMDGVWQHYGLYLPDGWEERPTSGTPVQWWFHWRGGQAHSAAAVIPRMFQTLGDGVAATPVTSGIADSVVVAPRGRGTSTWYVGWGMADFFEVWDDVHALLGTGADRSREYVTGHSMGGWASYLFPILFPDRFAGSMPYAGPVTQGAWTGLDFPGCDEFQWDEYTPCYVSANESRPRDQHTRRLLENMRHVPVAVMQGALDELVPVSGVTRQVERLVQLGYRHRYYLFPTYEHFSHPIVDEWVEAGRYVHRFAVPERPARVSYIRDVAFEEATEEVQSRGIPFDFSFDSAYWMRGLQVAPGKARAAFEGRSRAIADPPVLVTPEVGGPAALGQHGPFAMSGLAWLGDPVTAPPSLSNGFEATLRGASAVELDLAGMDIDAASVVAGHVDADGAMTLRLAGEYASVPPVACTCGPVEVALDGPVLVIQLPAGVVDLTIGE